MTYEEFGALWFVRKRLNDAQPDKAAQDRSLGTIDRVGLALALVDRIQAAKLVAGSSTVAISEDQLLTASSGWAKLFQVRDSLLESVGKGDGQHEGAAAAFADFLVIRWIYQAVWGFKLTERPSFSRPLPPTHDDQAKLGLAEKLIKRADMAELEVDVKALKKASADWESVFDVRDSILG
jgi:hypothetical protein